MTEAVMKNRILIMAPGKPLEEVTVTDEEARKLVGGHMTSLPAWAIPTIAFGVSVIGREFDPGENAPDNFLTYQYANKIRGTVIFTAADDDGMTRDLTDREVEKVTLLVGKVERLPEIETDRPADEFVLMVPVEDSTPDPDQE